MGKQFDALDATHIAFIDAQHMFFCGSAAPTGLVNISPKGRDSLRVLGPNRIVWLNLTGSGNETAGHLLENPRMTLMWCGFERRPQILRCYGTAVCLHRDHADFAEYAARFGSPEAARQIYDMTIDMVQTSCGYAVPFYDHVGPRDTLERWAEDKGPDGLSTYWDTRNRTTLDGRPTGIEANLKPS
ncbi:MAG: pyridoxamine 5'-phosphate oxidase family protein [Paracoccaceae bacterium]